MVINKKTRVTIYVRVGNEKEFERAMQLENERKEKKLEKILLFNKLKVDTTRGILHYRFL